MSTSESRAAIDAFRDATREGRLLDFRKRDPLVMVLHQSLDRLERLELALERIKKIVIRQKHYEWARGHMSAASTFTEIDEAATNALTSLEHQEEPR